MHVAFADIGLGDKDGAFRWLTQAYRQRDEWLVYLHVYTEFYPLRSDRRFQDLERRVGLVR